MSNALLATQLLLQTLDRATAVASVIKTAQAEGRDITVAELDAAIAQDDAARTALDEAIKKARGNG